MLSTITYLVSTKIHCMENNHNEISEMLIILYISEPLSQTPCLKPRAGDTFTIRYIAKLIRHAEFSDPIMLSFSHTTGLLLLLIDRVGLA